MKKTPVSIETQNKNLLARHIPALDGIRGAAILYVIFHHTCDAIFWNNVGWTGHVYEQLLRAGWMGVDLFFVLSGFLITSILVQTKGKTHWIRNFIARRALRVLPLYYLTVFVCLVLLPLVPIPSVDWLRDLSHSQLWYWFHLTNFRRIASILDGSLPTVGWMSTFWSLSVEEHFYLVWPFLVAYISLNSLTAAAIFCALLSVGARIVLAFKGFDGQIIYYSTFTRLDGLFLGSAIAAWVLRGGSLASLRRAAPWCILLGLLGFILPLALGFEGSGRDSTFYGKTLLYLCAALLSSGVVVLNLDPSSRRLMPRIFSSQFLTTIGKFSYGMYIFNKPIIVLVQYSIGWLKISAGGVVYHILATFFVILLTWSAAWVSWNVIEKHFVNLKRFFADHDRVQKVPVRSTDKVALRKEAT